LTLRTAEPPSLVSEAVADAAAGLPYYLANLSVALLLLTIALAVYALLAGRADLVRARRGHVATAASVSGVLLGFALPLASVLMSAGSLLDLLLWSGAALGVQLIAVLILRRVLVTTPATGDGDQGAGGLLHGALSIAVGLINAAALVL